MGAPESGCTANLLSRYGAVIVTLIAIYAVCIIALLTVDGVYITITTEGAIITT
jgi:hypothetical protein